MALEIERRFLVRGEAWREHVRWCEPLQQGYLTASAEGFTLRVRCAGSGEAWLTLKAPHPAAQEGLVRHEFEYAIPRADAEQLLAMAPQQLRKCRYGLAIPGGHWVLDVFEAANAPLVVAEVELQHPDQALGIPDWCVQELTGRHELSNAALALRPLASWPEHERQPLLALLA